MRILEGSVCVMDLPCSRIICWVDSPEDRHRPLPTFPPPPSPSPPTLSFLSAPHFYSPARLSDIHLSNWAKNCADKTVTLNLMNTTEIIIIIIAFGPYKSSPGTPILGQSLKLSPGLTRPLCFSLQMAAPGVSWAALISLFLWVPGQGLTCEAGHWLLEGVSSPSSASSEINAT